MAQGSEEIKNRLDNIYAIQPLLEALRTISLSNWRVSLKRIAWVNNYLIDLQDIYNGLTNYDPEILQPAAPAEIKKQQIIILGSNRGLCGNFNRDLMDELARIEKGISHEVQIIVFGERLKKLLERKKISFSQYFPFPNAVELTSKFVLDFLDQISLSKEYPDIELIFNRYRGAGKYNTIHSPVFPNSFIKKSQSQKSFKEFTFDTPPIEIFSLMKNELHFLSIYFAFLLSSAAEHSKRFQLMENASTNADDLSGELFQEVQALRRQKITEEMQELAIGAGLLNKQR
jgi:F-type H+-transporting ATPase subunit gamma